MRLTALALILLAPAADQDPEWWRSLESFCESRDPSQAATMRRVLKVVETPECMGLTQALRSVIIEIEQSPAIGKKRIKAIGKYMKKVGAPPISKEAHLRALTIALKVKGGVGELLALGHIDQLLQSGVDPAEFKGAVKALKLVPVEGGLATATGSLLARMRAIKDGRELVRMTERSRDMGLIYYSVVALMKNIAKEDKSPAPVAREQLTRLGRWAPNHVALLVRMLEMATPCPSCSDKAKVRCFACGGRKSRRVVCPQCDGKGSIHWDPSVEKPEKRKEIDGIRRLSGTRSYCPSCLGNPGHKVASKKCEFCAEEGWVECQRCKWQKWDFAMFGTIAPCGNCKGTGMMFSKVAHPCAFCRGLGGFLEPASDPSVLIGPTN